MVAIANSYWIFHFIFFNILVVWFL